MRLRMLGAATVALACLISLSACRSNVGVAATISGHRISESSVTSYFTAQAQSLPQTDQTTGAQLPALPPRTWVLVTILRDRLFTEALAGSAHGAPSAAEISSTLQQLYAGANTTEAAVIARLPKGYTRKFIDLYLHEQVTESIISTQANSGDTTVNRSIGALVGQVEVNPRYGSWDQKTATLNALDTASLPSYLTLVPAFQPPDVSGGSS